MSTPVHIPPHKHDCVRMVDIDGTILEKKEVELYSDAQPLPYSIDILWGWMYDGDYVVLWTARPEELREFTEEQLTRLGIPYHELHMEKPYSHNLHIYDDNSIVSHRVDRVLGLQSSEDINEQVFTKPQTAYFPLVPGEDD